jgi:hypothetical protein
MSGSLPILFGLAWCRLCLFIHQPWLIPTSVARTRPLRSLAGPESKIWRWEALVPQEGELGKDQAQATGQQQLQPGVLEQDHSGGAASQCQHQHCEDHHVEAAAATLQPSAADGLGQLGERVGKRLVA